MFTRIFLGVMMTMGYAGMAVTLQAQDCQTAFSFDSVQVLPDVIVTAPVSYKQVIPAQKLSGTELERLNGHSVADALKLFAGVQLKDYGGVGGIKTINIRSMGTHHVGVFYDGIELSNAQNGQIDLGMYSLDNIGEISLYNGQKSNIFQPAKDFGSAGSVYLSTRRPQFEGKEFHHVKATLRSGSFDLFNPSLLFENRVGENVTSSFNAEWLNSCGKYKFRYRRIAPSGELAYDTTAIRENGDVNALRLDANLYGETTDGGEWNIKGYSYHSERGIPGAIVNNVWRRGERVWDSNSFAQAHYEQNFGSFSTQLNAKYAFYRTHYVNDDITQMEIDNLYKQREFYISLSNIYQINRYWEVSAAYDFQYNKMWSDLYGFVMPVRRTHLLALATAVQIGNLKAQISGLFTRVEERTEKTENPPSGELFTPALFLAYRPFGKQNLSIRAFYKRTFRMPTFNDLYYADMGNSKLAPEEAAQYDMGAVWEKRWREGFWRAVELQADGYYNSVTNKIICYPKGQQFRWTMLNLGKVDIRGADISASLSAAPLRNLVLTAKLQYTWQRAIDVTDREDTYYRDQIPYIPHHSGTAVAAVEYGGWQLNYSFMYVGERYNQQENIKYNYTQPWYTSDLSLGKTFNLEGCHIRGLVECNNLLSQDYDVILNYPMPKRNWRITFSIGI